MSLIIAIHVIACALLIIIILIQAGRGGGLVESFSGVESMFGTKTHAFLTRSTTILSIVFFLTCITLAFLSARQSGSLLKNTKDQGRMVQPTTQPQGEVQPQAQTKDSAQQKNEASAEQAPVRTQQTQDKAKTE